MGFVWASSIGLGLALLSTAASAQATPFLFTVMPPVGQSKSAAYGYYELGYGERTFDFASAADHPLPTRNGYVLRSAVGFNW